MAIGHGLHRRDPVFRRFGEAHGLLDVAGALGLAEPYALQSMAILKPPGIGGEVGWHQDATFLQTEPPSVVGLWFALDDATRDDGCLWAIPGGHHGPLRQRWDRHPDDRMEFYQIPSPGLPHHRADEPRREASQAPTTPGTPGHAECPSRVTQLRHRVVLALTASVACAPAASSPLATTAGGNATQESMRVPPARDALPKPTAEMTFAWQWLSTHEAPSPAPSFPEDAPLFDPDDVAEARLRVPDLNAQVLYHGVPFGRLQRGTPPTGVLLSADERNAVLDRFVRPRHDGDALSRPRLRCGPATGGPVITFRRKDGTVLGRLAVDGSCAFFDLVPGGPDALYQGFVGDEQRFVEALCRAHGASCASSDGFEAEASVLHQRVLAQHERWGGRAFRLAIIPAAIRKKPLSQLTHAEKRALCRLHEAAHRVGGGGFEFPGGVQRTSLDATACLAAFPSCEATVEQTTRCTMDRLPLAPRIPVHDEPEFTGPSASCTAAGECRYGWTESARDD